MLSHSANFFSNLLTRSEQKELGSLTSKYRRQYLPISESSNFSRISRFSVQWWPCSIYSSQIRAKPLLRGGKERLYNEFEIFIEF